MPGGPRSRPAFCRALLIGIQTRGLELPPSRINVWLGPGFDRLSPQRLQCLCTFRTAATRRKSLAFRRVKRTF